MCRHVCITMDESKTATYTNYRHCLIPAHGRCLHSTVKRRSYKRPLSYYIHVSAEAYAFYLESTCCMWGNNLEYSDKTVSMITNFTSALQLRQ